MTKNNLRTHLAWLLNAKPFLPPPTQHIVLPIVHAPPSSSTLGTQDFAVDINIAAPTGDAHAHRAPRSQPAIPEVRPQSSLPSRYHTLDETEEIHTNDEPNSAPHSVPTDMARLRAVPGSASKPRLVLQAQSSGNTPKPNRSLQKAGPSDCLPDRLAIFPEETTKRRPDTKESARRPAPQANGKDRRHGKESLAEQETGEVDAIDLTGDSDSRAESSPIVRAGMSRKRKSDEFEDDPQSGPSKQRPRMETSSAEAFDGAFAPVEDFEDPPPPYSTVVDKTPLVASDAQSLLEEDDGESSDLQAASAVDLYVEERHRVSESPITSVPRKRKPLSRLAPDHSEAAVGAVSAPKPSRSPQKVTWDRETPREGRSPVKATHSSKRRIIVDSEDEDEDSETQPVPNFSAPGSTKPNPASHLRSPDSKRATSRMVIDESKDFRWHECKGDPTSPSEQPKELDATVRKQIVTASSSHRIAVRKDIVGPPAATPGSSQASPSTLSEDERKVVSAFMEWPDMRLETVCKDFDLQIRELARAQADYCGNHGDFSDELYVQAKEAKERKKVIEDLVRVRTDFDRASQSKDELITRAVKAMEAEDSDDFAAFQETKNQLKIVNDHLKKLEVEVLRLLGTAELLEGSGESVRLCEPEMMMPTDVVIRSTQATPYSDAKLRIPDSSNMARTQFVQQTQFGTRSPKTPSRRRINQSPTWYREADQVDFSTKRQNAKSANPAETYSRARIAEYTLPKASAHASTGEGIFIDENDIEEDEEALFSTNMGTPPMRVADDDEFGDFDFDDDDVLDMAEDHENHGTTRVPDLDRGPRQVFQETSGNHIRVQERSTTTSRKPTAKPSKSMGPPAAQLQFTWSTDVKKALKDRFRLRGFRPHQLEAINATLSGKDCFVLMPTGGGKSLCYQLPSVISTGRTRGVTVVISPLLSLMEDQVTHLRDLRVQAFHINGEISYDARRQIMDGLREPQVEKFIQVLYVTPEMLSKNQAMINLLQDLHRRQRLARIVIDEAHCVSQWGHDFRPDYKALGEVRKQFFGVPVMALTATATENVKVDVIHNLGIQGCEVFAQSFNRPNLYYEVRPKARRDDLLESFAELIKSQYRGQCGIIYCLSRKKCEEIAEQLREKHGIKALPYHAGMDPAKKSDTQKQWQAGRYKVIVATIAFGMGIDKPDVRFVIHQSIPKSLEGYYQETGRAGRDGKRSGCYLYYGYQDTVILKRMIDAGDGSRQQKERQYAMLRNVVQYCENKADCRRVQVLAYFNEAFNAEECDAECDNCNSTGTFEHRDFTDLAAQATNLVQKIQQQKVTLLHCVDVFRGSSSKKIKALGHDSLKEHGAGSDLERGDVERLFQRLVSEDALQEENSVNKAGFASQYIKLGPNFQLFQSRRRPLQIHVRVSPMAKGKKAKAAPKKAKTGVAAARDDHPLSTNVSSPIQAASRRRQGRLADSGDDNDDGFVVHDEEAEAFEPRSKAEAKAKAAKTKKAARQELGPPITVDEKMARLDDIHQDIVEGFVQRARQLCRDVMLKRDSRGHPFTDTMLREMAISFPLSRQEMLEIPEINAEMVRLYGERFLKLIKETKTFYENILEERSAPRDPNHEIVEISDDDEEQYGEDLDLDEESSQELRSLYFADPAVEAFNARFDQSQGASGAGDRPTAAAPPSRSKPGGASRTSYARKGSRRSSGEWSGKARGAGVTKKTATRKRSGGGPSRNTKRGGGGLGGIGMMPT